MADLYVKEMGMINPVVVASSPATQGARNVLKSAAMRPGAIVLRNFGHGAGGGSFIGPDSKSMYAGGMCVHSHAVGTQIKDSVSTLEQYCEEVRRIKKEMDSDIKLWVSVGHYSDIVKGGDWEKDWANQAKELKNAGADAIELHFNTPGVAVAKDRTFDYYGLLRHCIELMKRTVPDMPIMAKLTLEGCDVLTSMRIAEAAGAAAAGPTARWKGFLFDLDWRKTEARPGAGYGGTQATPLVCYAVAEARKNGIRMPLYGGGGVFNYEQALRILMAGSNMVQLGALACAGGVGAGKKLIADMNRFMDENGYPDMESLTGDALKLFNMSGEITAERQKKLGDAYRMWQVTDACVGCGRCVDVCWHDGIRMEGKKAKKTENCIGCGYCFQVCPSGALKVNSADILSSVFDEHHISRGKKHE
jgi:dihydropyrimidine dehydrogenase (NAD+) subunit PreA